MNINLKKYQSTLIILSVLLIPLGAQSGEVTSTFSPGGTLTSTQMNEIKDAVNDNNTNIGTNTTAIANFFGGNGSGGDITIDTSNDNWSITGEIPANLNFSNFTIPIGTTLSVPAGTTIRCTGAFTNAGTITVLDGGRHQTTGFSSTGNSGSSGPMNAIHPGDTLAAATNGQFDNNAIAVAKSLQGGRGGIGIPEMMARTSFAQFRIGGGAGGGNTSANSGGGLIKVYCTGPITNTGTINAIGDSDTYAGGGGGIVVLASQTSVDNSAGTIDVSGGNGGTGSNFSGSSGGGGGGIVIMISPTAPVSGTETVAGGTGGAAGTATTQSRLAGSGGGASGGNGGNGGFVGSTGTASAGSDGQSGYVLVITDDPGLLAH